MIRQIAILEDDAGRIAAFQNAVAMLDVHLRLGDTADEMIEILKAFLPTTSILSLDHDLGPNRESLKGMTDPGTGRQVVDWLVTQKPTCPVILHTSNLVGRDGMEFALKASGWTVEIVSPTEKDWVRQYWLPGVRQILKI